MEVQSTTQTTSTQETTQTKSTESSTAFTVSSTNDNSINELSDLTFENIQTLTKDDIAEIFKDDKNSLEKATMLKNLSQKTNDGDFNKIIFNHAKDMDINDIKTLSFILDESSTIDRYSGIILSPEDLDEVSSSLNGLSSKRLTLNSYEDSYEFIDSTIEHLDTSYKNNRFMMHPDEAEISQKFTELFKDIKDEYIDAIDDDKSILGEYMRTIKPLILEEEQKIQESEQLKKDMEIYGLDSSSNIQKFEYELIQEGYTRKEARERTMLYNHAGLISDSDTADKFGINLYNLGMLSRNPELKNSMMEAYAQMDTNTLREVSQRMSRTFSIDMESMKKIMGPEEDANPEEIMKRADDYWNNEYGTTEQVLNMFQEKLDRIKIDQKFTTDDLSYITDGFNLLIDIFIKNSKQKEDN